MASRFVTDHDSAAMSDFVLRHQRDGRDFSEAVLDGIDAACGNLSDQDILQLRQQYGTRSLLASAEKLVTHLASGPFVEDVQPLDRDVGITALTAGCELRHKGGKLREAIAAGDMEALDRREALMQAAYPSQVEDGAGDVDPVAMEKGGHFAALEATAKAVAPETDQQHDDAGAGGPSLARHARGGD